MSRDEASGSLCLDIKIRAGYDTSMDAQERRRFLRTRCGFPLAIVSHPSPEVSAMKTLTKDVGMGGLRCISPVPSAVSSLVSLELDVGVDQEPLRLLGRTVWFQQLPRSDQYQLGIAFQDVSEETGKRLSEHLQRLVRQSRDGTSTPLQKRSTPEGAYGV